MNFKLKPPLGTPLLRSHSLVGRMLSYWLMNEQGGTLVKDSKRQIDAAFDSTNPPIWVSDGVECSSTLDHIDLIPVADVPNIGSIWFRYRYISTPGAFYYWLAEDDTHNNFVLLGNIPSANDCDFRINAVQLQGMDLSTLIDGNIHDLFLLWNSDTNHMACYLDEALVAEQTLAFTMPTWAGNYISLGARTTADRHAGGVFQSAALFNYELTHSEIKSLHIDPYQVFKSPYPIELFSTVEAGVTVDATLGTISIADQTPSVSVGTGITATQGQATISGLNPDIAVGVDIDSALGTVSIGALNAQIAQGIDIDATLGTTVISGLDADVSLVTTINANTGAISVDPYAAEVAQGIDIDSILGALTIQGLNADVSTDLIVLATTGNLNIQGFNPVVSAGLIVEASTGVVVISGLNPVVLLPTDIDAGLGQIQIQGLNAGIISTVNIVAGLGPVNIVGINPIVTIGDLVPSPLSRKLVIGLENRTYTIGSENRIYKIT